MYHIGGVVRWWIAAELLIQAPELIEDVILLAPAGLDEHASSPTILNMAGSEVLERASVPRSEKGKFSPSEPMVEIMERNLAAARNLVPGVRLKDANLADRLAKVSNDKRVIIYWGACDAVLPRGIAREWKTAMPDSHVSVLADTGHGILGSQRFSLQSV